MATFMTTFLNFFYVAVLCVKESGLGQISFSIIPKMVGFLPYPSINIYCCADKRMITV